MKTHATKKDKRIWIKDKIRIAAWNVRDISQKEEELARILERLEIDFAAVSETKKKLCGSQYVSEYIMLHSGVKREERASKGVSIYIHRRWEKHIRNYEFINERIIRVRIRLEQGNLTAIAVYAPEEGKREESIAFYDTLQQVIKKYNQSDQILLFGDLNARVGNTPISKCIGPFGEDVCNQNGQLLREFVTYNNLNITNTFFKKKDIHKYIWSARGYRSIIDYIITNNKIRGQVRDT